MKKLTEQDYINQIKSRRIKLNSVPNESMTNEICMAAVRRDGVALEYVESQTDEICLAAVNQNGWSLQFVKNQTEEICLAAVDGYAPALKFVKEQTEEICLAAVKSGWSVIKYVENQTDSIINAALFADHTSFLLVDASKYNYNPKQMIDIFNNLSECYRDDYWSHNNKSSKENMGVFASKLIEVLSVMSYEDLSKCVKNDLKSIFDSDLMLSYDSIFNLKQKVLMLENVASDGLINENKSKLKII